MRISLDLSHHCVETAMKRQFEMQLGRYFSDAAARDELEPLLDALSDILASWDFSYLRSTFPALSGGAATPPVFLVVPEDDPLPFLEISEKRIDPPLRHPAPI